MLYIPLVDLVLIASMNQLSEKLFSQRVGSDEKNPQRLHPRIPTLNAMHTSRRCFLHIASAAR